MKHAFDTDVLVDIGPVNSVTGPDETKVRSLLRRGLCQSPRPNKRHADNAAVYQVRDDLVLSNPHLSDARIFARRSAHAMPRE